MCEVVCEVMRYTGRDADGTSVEFISDSANAEGYRIWRKADLLEEPPRDAEGMLIGHPADQAPLQQRVAHQGYGYSPGGNRIPGLDPDGSLVPMHDQREWKLAEVERAAAEQGERRRQAAGLLRALRFT